jgi:hypothetical protein
MALKSVSFSPDKQKQPLNHLSKNSPIYLHKYFISERAINLLHSINKFMSTYHRGVEAKSCCCRNRAAAQLLLNEPASNLSLMAFGKQLPATR